MDILGLLWRLVAGSVTSTSGTARMLFGFHLTRGTLWSAMLLMTILNTLILLVLNTLIIASLGADLPPGLAQQAGQTLPLVHVLVRGAFSVLLVFALHYTAVSMKGTGGFEGSLMTVLWKEVLVFVMFLGVLAVMLISPTTGALLFLGGYLVIACIVAVFLSQLHGFDSPWSGAGVMLLASIGIIIGLTMLLILIGVGTGVSAMEG